MAIAPPLPPHPAAHRPCLWGKKDRSCKHSGPDCPFSHGVEVPSTDLLPFKRDGANLAGDASASTLEERTGQERRGKGGRGEPSSSDRGANAGDDDWLASLSSGHGHRVLARYHDRVWYEATVEGAAGEGGSLAVRFKGFEDDGSVSIPADHSHLAPVEEGADGIAGLSRGGGSGGGGGLDGSPGSDGEENEIEDAWADAAHTTAKKGADGETGSGFFQERVLGERGWGGGGGGGGPNVGARGAAGTAAAAGGASCSDAYIVGDWEQHTKGFGSRMMSRMGYRRGEGLGREKQVRRGLFVYADWLRGEGGRPLVFCKPGPARTTSPVDDCHTATVVGHEGDLPWRESS